MANERLMKEDTEDFLFGIYTKSTLADMHAQYCAVH